MPSFEIRSLTQDEMPEFRRLGSYAFANNSIDASDQPGVLKPEWTLGAFDGSQLVACSGAFPFTLRLNGNAVAAHGITGVATDPGYRRQGAMRQLMRESFERARVSSASVSILWASLGAIYQRFGYGLGSLDVSYRIEPRHLVFAFDTQTASSGEQTRLLPIDTAMDELVALHRSFNRSRNLMLKRFPPMWDTLQQDKPVYCALHYDAAGEVTGSVLYRTAWDGSMGPTTQQTLTIVDLMWLDMGTYRALWQYLAAHDLVGEIVYTHAAEDDPLPMLLLEPRRLNRRTDDGLWLRVVNVEAVLGLRGYRQPGYTTLEIVGDDYCPWNNGIYTLDVRTEVETGGFTASVSRLPSTVTSSELDLSLSPQAFARLISGQSSATTLAQAGMLTNSKSGRLAHLDSLFATRYRPFGPDHF